jgi:hypothetical protein
LERRPHFGFPGFNVSPAAAAGERGRSAKEGDVLDLFLKLIDRLIDLVKRRQELNKASFTDFVAPAMADLEAVHKDYLDRFGRYRDLLEDKKIPLNADHPLFGTIEKDNLFSEGLRSKILELDALMDDKVFGHFMSDVKWYVSGAATPPENVEYEPWDGRSQMRLVGYSVTLGAILKGGGSEAVKRTLAIKALDEAVHSVQRYYSKVLEAFTELKKKLLQG